MKKSFAILCFFVILKIVLQYVIVNPIYELHRDEFLHLDQAKHLAWGFHSVPPFTSWISWIIYQLGNSVFWVRFFPALFGALTIVIVWKAVEKLGGGLYACILAATSLLISVLLRLNILFQPNSFDVLCYTALFYFVVCYIKTSNTKWLYTIAVGFALGFLNKYNIVFALFGLFPALLLSRHRSIFFNPHFYGSLLLALVLITPNLIWQVQHDFPVLKHMEELKATQLVHVSSQSFLEEQIFFFLGSISVLVAGFLSFFVYQPLEKYRFMFFSYLFSIVIFLYLHAKGYYAIGLYPIFMAFGSVYLEHLFQRKIYFLRYVSVLVILAFAYPLVKIALPVESPERYVENYQKHLTFSSHTWEDGKKHPIVQDFADMLGWKELAHKVDSLFIAVRNPTQTLILCDNYGHAGGINFYTEINNLQADCLNTDYDGWINLERPIYTMIRVMEQKNLDLSKERQLFDSVRVVATLESTYAREKDAKIVLLQHPKTDITAALKKFLGRQ